MLSAQHGSKRSHSSITSMEIETEQQIIPRCNSDDRYEQEEELGSFEGGNNAGGGGGEDGSTLDWYLDNVWQGMGTGWGIRVNIYIYI